MALDLQADLLYDLGQYSECIAAENKAIANSDGKYAFMQFRLGTCYAQAQNWARAEAAFRISAEADKTDAASAYDLALSLQNEGYGGDAQHWYREALNRKPDDELRAKIVSALK